MKNILLLTDFSDNSMNAIEYALLFFRKWDCKFFVLHVQKSSEYISDDLMTADPGSAVYKAVLEESTNKLSELIKTLQQKHKGAKYDFQPLLDYDNFIDAIKQAVTNNSIELMVMGRNGATGAKEVLFGSNTMQVIRNINNWILVVPEAYKFQGIKSVLLSIHKEQESRIGDMRTLKDILIKYKAELKVLDVLQEENEQREGALKGYLQKIFKEISFEIKSVIGLKFPDAISAYEQLEKTDLHALIMEKEQALDRIFYGSENKTISEGSQVPLLILPEKDLE